MVSLDTSDFMRDLEKALEEIPEAVIMAKKTLILEAHKNLIYSNPVDTGRSRASWLITDEDPSSEKPPEGSYAISSALERENAVNTIKPFTDTYITNNQDYIEGLNEGKSVQAPAGWVEAAVDLAEEVVGGQINDF